MDAYIRDYLVRPVDTRVIDSINDCNNYINTDRNVNSLSLLHINIRSISRNFNQLEILLSQIKNLDVIVLSETRILSQPGFFHLDGYSLVYSEGKVNQNDGVIAYVKNSIKYDYKIADLGEIKSIELTLYYCEKVFRLLCVYRLPATNDKTFVRALEDYLIRNERGDCDCVFLVGDVNIDILTESEVSQDYLDVLSEHDFFSLINKPTHYKTCLDHIFVKCKNGTQVEEDKAIILQCDITDHDAVLAGVSIQSSVAPDSEATAKSKVKKLDKNKLCRYLQSEDWYAVFSRVNAGEAADHFLSILGNHIDNSTYYQKPSRKDKGRKSWITPGLVNSVMVKNSLYRAVAKNPGDVNLVRNYKMYRNTLITCLRNAKRLYYGRELERRGGDAKSLWTLVNKLSGKNRKQGTQVNMLRLEDSKVVTGKQEIVDSFNSYFVNVGVNLAGKIAKVPQFGEKTKLDDSLFLYPTNETEVKEMIGSLKHKHSSGVDGISSITLKCVANYISLPLAHIFNHAIVQGLFPNSFKKAIITPLYKKGDRKTPGNYRPISLISSVSKVFEKILCARIQNYLTKHNVVSSSQFGFQKNKSAQDAIAELTGGVYASLDAGKCSACVFIDLAKAFDTVSHPLLLQSLEEIGVRGTPLKLFRSYLKDREQMVKVNGVLSDVRMIKYGVPQGTVLGPLLFILYVNNLFNLSTRGRIISFADDTAIYFEADSWEELRRDISSDMELIGRWFNSRLLTINWEKTSYVPFALYKGGLPNFQNVHFYLDRKQITLKSVSSVKYLGVFIDCHFRWDIQVNYLKQKLRGLLFAFRELKKCLDASHLRSVYYSLVESQLFYGIIGWGGVRGRYLCQLETLQRRFLKTIYNRDPLYSTDLLYSETAILDVRLLYAKAIFAYTFEHRGTLQIIDHNYSTRYQREERVKVPRASREIGSRCHKFLAPRLYNQLPSHLKDINNKRLFLKKVNKWLRETPRMSMRDKLGLD